VFSQLLQEAVKNPCNPAKHKYRKFRQDLQDLQDSLFSLFLKKSEKLKPSPLVDCTFPASSGSREIKKNPCNPANPV
jgi:hypothetical protein